MKRIFILCLLLIPTACVNRDATFTNAAGNHAHCSVFGWGVAGSIMARHMYQNCVASANARGYM